MVGTIGTGGLRERGRVVGTEGGGGRGARCRCCLLSCCSHCVGSCSCPPAMSLLCPPWVFSLCPPSMFLLFGRHMLLLFYCHASLLHVGIHHHNHRRLSLSDHGVV